MLHSEEASDGITIARLEGELDKFAADEVLAELESLPSSPGLVVNLGGLTFLDSAGLHALFAAARFASERGTRLAFVLPHSSPIRRVLELVQIGTVAPVRHSQSEAIELVRADAATMAVREAETDV